MKAFMNLVLNEIIKVWKQTGYRVVIFIMLGLTILSPILNLVFSAGFLSFNAEDEYETYREWADDSDGIEYEYYNAYAEAYKFFIDNDIEKGWQYENFSYEYSELYVAESGYKLIVDGRYDADEVVKWFGISLNDKSEAEARYTEAKNNRRDLEKQILMSESQFIPAVIESKNEEISMLNDAVETAERDYKAQSTDENERAVVLARLNLDIAKAELECLETIDERESGPDSWEYKLMKENMSQHTYDMLSNFPLSEKEYDEMYSWTVALPYEDYVKNCEGNVDFFRKEFNKCVYAIENDIDIYSANVNSETAITMESAVSNFGIVMMVIVASMIAGEYTKGTIRLLLIRPRSRTQIIMSKLVAATLILTALTVASLFLVSIENLLIYGAGSFFDIITIGDAPTKIPAFLITLGVIAVAMLTVLADMALTALIASLTKKTGTAITLPIVIKFAISSVILAVGIVLMQMLPGIFGWLIYSPIPYISMASSTLYDGFFTLPGFWRISVWLGILYHVVFIAALVWLTVIRFKKTQIKG